jgi:hypothetical protein
LRFLFVLLRFLGFFAAPGIFFADVMYAQLLPPTGPRYETFKASANLPMGEAEFVELRDCEQRSKLWEKKRKIKAQQQQFVAKIARFTGSITGKLLSVNPYESCAKGLYGMTHGTTFTGNVATRWGTNGESYCEEAFRQYLLTFIGWEHPAVPGSIIEDVELLNYGLVVDREEPQHAYSPDGVVHWTVRQPAPLTPSIVHFYELDEYKCPYKVRDWQDFTTEDPYPTHQIALVDHELELPVPDYYYSQVQWGMYVMHKAGVINRRDHAHFVVWFPSYDPRDRRWPEHTVARSGPNQQSLTVQGQSGAFQYALVPFNQNYVDMMLKTFRDQWEHILLPEAWRVAQQNAHLAASFATVPRPLVPQPSASAQVTHRGGAHSLPFSFGGGAATVLPPPPPPAAAKPTDEERFTAGLAKKTAPQKNASADQRSRKRKPLPLVI